MREPLLLHCRVCFEVVPPFMSTGDPVKNSVGHAAIIAGLKYRFSDKISVLQARIEAEPVWASFVSGGQSKTEVAANHVVAVVGVVISILHISERGCSGTESSSI